MSAITWTHLPRRHRELSPRVATPATAPSHLRTALSWSLTLALAVGVFAAIRLAGIGLVVVTTNSMEPTLMPRDYVVTIPTRWSTPEIGSIIVFQPDFNDAALPRFVHRIVGTYPDGTWKTKGDNAGGLDPWRVHPRQVIGVATSIRLPANVTQNPWTFGLAAFFVALLVLWPRRTSREPASQP